jgi:hypothetical protein
MEPEEDNFGLRKVCEIENFRGIFRDTQGKNFDLRPKDICPSLNNFRKMEKSKL